MSLTIGGKVDGLVSAGNDGVVEREKGIPGLFKLREVRGDGSRTERVLSALSILCRDR